MDGGIVFLTVTEGLEGWNVEKQMFAQAQRSQGVPSGWRIYEQEMKSQGSGGRNPKIWSEGDLLVSESGWMDRGKVEVVAVMK